jgi:hypothetical protein
MAIPPIASVRPVTFVPPVRRIVAGRRGQQQPTEAAATLADNTARERVKLRPSPNASTAIDINNSETTTSGANRAEGKKNRAQKPKKVLQKLLRQKPKLGLSGASGQRFNTDERSKGYAEALRAMIDSWQNDTPPSPAATIPLPSVEQLQRLSDKILDPVPGDTITGLVFCYRVHKTAEQLSRRRRG